MRVCFADAQYYIAILSAADESHVEAVAATERFRGRVVTTQWVLAEVANALAEPGKRSGFLRLLEALKANRSVEIAEASGESFQRGAALYAARPDKAWSLTDCISFVVMEERGIRDALTADRHFEQAGFHALLLK